MTVTFDHNFKYAFNELNDMLDAHWSFDDALDYAAGNWAANSSQSYDTASDLLTKHYNSK